MKRVLYFVSAVCLLLYSCSKDDEKTLILSENNVAFTSDGGNQEIAVTANTNWEVKYEADWFDIETSGNMGNGSIVINVQPNYLIGVNRSRVGYVLKNGIYSTDERSAEILVTTQSGGIIQKITISQKGYTEDTSFQVYDSDGTLFKGNIDLVGVPNISNGAFDYIGDFPSSSMGLAEYPWQIKGEVKDGIMYIDFPNDKFELPSYYENSTEGLTFGQVFIKEKNSSSLKIGLYKIGDDSYNQVYILYVSDDFSNELVTFKSGWNFIEIVVQNPNYHYGSIEPLIPIGIITQDINVFLEMGYRWQLERWICCVI